MQVLIAYLFGREDAVILQVTLFIFKAAFTTDKM